MDYSALVVGDEISFDDKRLKGVPLHEFTESCEREGLSALPNGDKRAFELRPSPEVDDEEEQVWVPVILTYGMEVQKVTEAFTRKTFIIWLQEHRGERVSVAEHFILREEVLLEELEESLQYLKVLGTNIVLHFH